MSFTDVLAVSPIILLLIYLAIRLGSAAFFQSKKDYEKRKSE